MSENNPSVSVVVRDRKSQTIWKRTETIKKDGTFRYEYSCEICSDSFSLCRGEIIELAFLLL
jgi:hypothetical protein